MTTQRRYRCIFCGAVLPGWLPIPKRPDGAMLLGHLGHQHTDQIGPCLERMRNEDIAMVAAEAYEVVGEDEPR